MKRHWQQRQSINTTLNFSDNIDAKFSIYFKPSIYYHVMIVIRYGCIIGCHLKL